ncbi:hypothetical protein QO058_01560 [Bosea vestrisii]|uniref:DUF6680 family protein n=1 Tax=Bosea vestrisii TaxID=151416 RepID=UPI0024E02C1C|nr:DUF6680 family protein [Bosea vestrisii]WID96999.1 hypothetical protein QO058_01560 [Bosea vestrisii]
MKTSDWIIAFATIAGPILAVQAQKYLERWQSRRQQKIEIFYALMGTRATRLAVAHVQALNRIELEFRPRRLDWLFYKRAAKDKNVIEAWRIYARHLNTSSDENNAVAWARDGMGHFYELLFKISQALGYDYQKSELMQGAYHPQGHGETEQLQHELLANAVKVVKGETSLAMRVTQFPFEVEPPAKPSDDQILSALMTPPRKGG